MTARYFLGAIGALFHLRFFETSAQFNKALNAELLPTGCAYAFANRIVWVALVISIGCESCEFGSLAHMVVVDLSSRGVGTVTHESGEAL